MFAFVAFASALGLTAVAERAETAGKIALAERLARDSSLPDDQLLFFRDGNMPPPWRRAFEEARLEVLPRATQLRELSAKIYVRSMTEADMKATVEFLETQTGASFERKFLRSVGDPKDLSANEAAAANAFFNSPSGRSFASTLQQAGKEMLPEVKAVGQLLLTRAQEIHCRETKDCRRFGF